MGNTKIKIAIIGAGPNGIASAMPFLEHKDKFDVTLISSGESLFSEEIITIQKYLNSVDKNLQHEFWETKKNFSKNFIPKKLFFGNKTVYQDFENDLKVAKDIEFDVSHSLGGLSNVWGATVSGLSQNDLEKYDYVSDFSIYLNTITKIFPISGFKDDIDLDTPYKIEYNLASLKYCTQAKKIMSLYESNKKYFKKNKFRIGFAKLAMDNNDNSGLEMYGSHKNSVFNSYFYIEKIKKDIYLLENTIVNEIIYSKNNIYIISKNKKNEITKSTYDKVIIAAGVINTAKLVLKLLSNFKKNSLIIKDSQKYFFLYFTIFKSNKNEEKNIIGLSQIFMQTEIKKNTFQLQLYHSILLLRDTMNNFLPKKFTKFLIKKLNFIFGRIMIGVVYFPEEISDHMRIKYNRDEKSFAITKVKNKNYSVKYILFIYAKLSKFLFRIKSFPLPVFIKAKVGVSQHFGSSLPPNNEIEVGKTSINGELYPFKNIYITDSSSLSRIPSTPPTFISMSNAYRVSSEIVNNS
tara:strand:- start:2043 stop:3599 length:1557 start_codon:yes stop_codon:yes gene_type:complete